MTSGLSRHAQVAGPLGVGEGAQVAALVDAPSSRLRVLHLGPAPGALVLELLEGQLLGRLDQVLLGIGVGQRGPGDDRGLLGAELAPPGRRVERRQLGEALGRAQGVDGLAHPGAGGAGQEVGRALVALPPPLPVSATRAAALALTTAAIFSMAAAWSSTVVAWVAVIRAGSKRPAKSSMPFRSSPSDPNPIDVILLPR